MWNYVLNEEVLNYEESFVESRKRFVQFLSLLLRVFAYNVGSFERSL